MLATGNLALAQPLVLLAIMLAPVLLPRAVLYPPPGEPPPDNSDGDSGGGGGSGPGPPMPSTSPHGGIPLPDAEPARVRRRDHDRPALVPRRERRPAREPDRRPRRAPARKDLPRR